MSAPLRVMLVDDEAPAREGLRLRLKLEPNVVVIGEFADARSALNALREEIPDLLFLDISMPGLDGFGLLERLGDRLPPAVVFVTAHEEHALRAFGVAAMDYLLKPVEQARLRETLARVRSHLDRVDHAEVGDRLRTLLRTLPEAGKVALPPATASGRGRIPVRAKDGSILLVAEQDIDWISAAGDEVTLHVGVRTHRLHRSMGQMMAVLDSQRFARIHRSTIVNLDRVRELQPHFHGEYIVELQDGTRLKLSRGQRAAVARLLGREE